MARKYSRDGAGRFASGNSHGDQAETIQQNKAKKTAEQKDRKEKLSGGKVGFGKRRRPTTRRRTVGAKATTRQAERAYAKSKRRAGN